MSTATSQASDRESDAVPPGYKQTDVGVIPEDWAVDTVASVTPRRSRYGIVDGPFGSNLKTIHYRTTGVPIVTSGYVTEGTFRADNYLYVDEEKFEQEKRSAVAPGDIVMAKIGARCGASAILPTWHATGILSGNTLKITVDETRHSTFFIWQLLWNLYSSGNIEALKSVGAQPAVSMPSLKAHLVQLPPRPEQRAIAAALADIDDLISALISHISKKQDIKQAMMQQLLTGRTRLPGFDGEWHRHTLGELGLFMKGRGIRRDDVRDRGVACIRYGEIYTRYDNHTDHLPSRVSESVALTALSIRSGDLLFAGSGEIAEEIGKCVAYVGDEEAVAGGDIVVLRPKGSYDPLFLGHAFNNGTVASQKARLGQGDAVVHISATALSQVECEIPEASEQRAIGSVLRDIDNEIDLLTVRLKKAGDLKIGMMQELLTGRTRLPVLEVAV